MDHNRKPQNHSVMLVTVTPGRQVLPVGATAVVPGDLPGLAGPDLADEGELLRRLQVVDADIALAQVIAAGQKLKGEDEDEAEKSGQSKEQHTREPWS